MAMVSRGYTGDARTLAAFRIACPRRHLDRERRSLPPSCLVGVGRG